MDDYGDDDERETTFTLFNVLHLCVEILLNPVLYSEHWFVVAIELELNLYESNNRRQTM